jgi:hypothetical protein
MKQYLEFKGNEQYVGGDVVEYGSQASSLNLNRGPLVLKKELNSLYNYTQVKTGGMPLKWEDTELYLTGDYVSLNGVIYHALANSADELPPSASWEEVILNAATDTSGYTKFEADNLLALKYDKSNVPANPKFTDTIYDDSALSNEIVFWNCYEYIRSNIDSSKRRWFTRYGSNTSIYQYNITNRPKTIIV